MPFVASCFRCIALLSLAACTPTLNWREVVVPEMGAQAQFPCKPQRNVQAEIGLVHCEADGLRFVLGWRPVSAVGVESPVETALQAMAQRMNASIRGQLPGAGEPPAAPGYFLVSTEGAAAWVQLWVSGRSLRQALVIGKDSPDHRSAAEAFFASLRRGA